MRQLHKVRGSPVRIIILLESQAAQIVKGVAAKTKLRGLRNDQREQTGCMNEARKLPQLPSRRGADPTNPQGGRIAGEMLR